MLRILVLLVCFGIGASAAHADLFGLDSDGNLYIISTVDASRTFVGATGIDGPGSLHFRPSDGDLYTFSLGSGATLYSVDPSNAASAAVGTGFGIGFVFEGGLTTAPSGTTYATNQGSSSTAVLFTVNLDTGSAATVGALGSGSGDSRDIDGLLARSDGNLIGLDRVSNSLVVIDPTTPAITSSFGAFPSTIGATGGLGMEAGVAYAMTEDGDLYSFDMFAGTTTFIGNSGRLGWRGIAGTNVPEPATWALMSVMLAGVWLGRRRRT